MKVVNYEARLHCIRMDEMKPGETAVVCDSSIAHLNDGETGLIELPGEFADGVIVHKCYRHAVGIGHIDGLPYDREWYWDAKDHKPLCRVNCTPTVRDL
jgi:hypothetical protein